MYVRSYIHANSFTLYRVLSEGFVLREGGGVTCLNISEGVVLREGGGVTCLNISEGVV